MAKDTLALIEIAYRPARGKGPQANEAINDAIDALFMRLTDGLIEAGESTVRFLQEAP
jgi:hypothetical protein